MKKLLLLSAGLLVATGCTTQQVVSPPAASLGPQLSVERFLQAVNGRDFDSMSRIFGSRDGPIRDTGGTFGCFWKKIGSAFGGTSCQGWEDVELRMDAIAEILRHNDYNIVSEGRVAGRRRDVTRIGVDMSLPGRRLARDVGFVVVMTDRGWMVEQIELAKVTSATDR